MQLHFLVPLCVVAMACASVSDPRSPAPGDPAWLLEARAKAGQMERYDVRASDGWFRATVPARPMEAIVDAEDGQYGLRLDIGAPHPIACAVLRDAPDPPYFLQNASRATLSELARESAGVDRYGIADIDVGAIDGAIFMEIVWDVVLESAEGRTAGSVDLLYGIREGAGVFCTKIDIGFRLEFLAVFSQLLERLELAKPRRAAAFEDITLVSWDGQPVGLSVETVRIDEDGYVQDEQHYHRLYSTGGKQLAALTRYAYEWVDPEDLSMIHAGMVRVVNGTMALNVKLEWSGNQERWVVHGQNDGENFTAPLEGRRGPDTILASIRDVRELLASANPVGSSVEIRRWRSFAPTQVETSTLRITDIVDDEHVRAELESQSSHDEMVLDRRTGMFVSSIGKSESRVVERRRIYVAGSLSGFESAAPASRCRPPSRPCTSRVAAGHGMKAPLNPANGSGPRAQGDGAEDGGRLVGNPSSP
ncbi:MAG: hypothetical protein R3F21_02125 [Myxococcota bacterium]